MTIISALSSASPGTTALLAAVVNSTTVKITVADIVSGIISTALSSNTALTANQMWYGDSSNKAAAIASSRVASSMIGVLSSGAPSATSVLPALVNSTAVRMTVADVLSAMSSVVPYTVTIQASSVTPVGTAIPGVTIPGQGTLPGVGDNYGQTFRAHMEFSSADNTNSFAISGTVLNFSSMSSGIKLGVYGAAQSAAGSAQQGGAVMGGNFLAQIDTGASTNANICGVEIDVNNNKRDVSQRADALDVVALQIFNGGNFTSKTALIIANFGGTSKGFLDGIFFYNDTIRGGWPIDMSNCVSAIGAMLIPNNIHISALSTAGASIPILGIDNSGWTTQRSGGAGVIWPNSSASANLMALTNAGDLGIGIVSPEAKLHVASSAIVIGTAGTPTSAAAGALGQIQWDASYVYVHTSTSPQVWKRSALSSF